MSIHLTRLETDEDVQRAMQAHLGGGPAATSPNGRPAPADDAPPQFRPTLRPPTALLTVQDDGTEIGQVVRIRTPQFVIGRTDGDLVIPHDSQMSSRHAEIRQSVIRNQYRWTLVDLNSTNGTFVRIGSALLEDGTEFMIGRSRLRFELPTVVDARTARVEPRAKQATHGWQAPVANDRSPAIVELTAQGEGRRILISTPETWLGKDQARCQLVLPVDPFISARHAHVRCDEEGRWMLENNKSVNGVWVRVEQIGFKGSCRFMLGEQQFMVRVP